MRHHWSPLIVVLTALLAMPATTLRAVAAQQEAVHWHNDLESAKVVAKETGRLVLVHFWTPSCGPCLALDQTVFNQPGVASALETQFVPVKLNADENSATAQWFGITRVPTDIIVTPDGQLVGKLISPPTPAAYVAEVTAAAGKYTSKGGLAYAKAAAAAPAQPQLNTAYANLPVSPAATPAIGAQQPGLSERLAVAPPVKTAENLWPQDKQLKAALAASPSPASSPAISPQIVTNPAVSMTSQPGLPPIAPAAAPAGAPTQVANPYFASATPSPAQQAPIAPQIPPGQAVPSGPALAGGAPDPRQLPPGAPPLGFDGYCSVSMRNSWKWVTGDPRWGVVHRGRTYWFAGPEEQKQFWTEPDRYTPALSGIDPVLALDHQQQVSGKREHSLDYDGLFYMFASEATLQQFTANPQRYATSARQAMGIPRGRLVR